MIIIVKKGIIELVDITATSISFRKDGESFWDGKKNPSLLKRGVKIVVKQSELKQT